MPRSSTFRTLLALLVVPFAALASACEEGTAAPEDANASAQQAEASAAENNLGKPRPNAAAYQALVLPLESEEANFRPRIAINSWQSRRQQVADLYRLPGHWGQMVHPSRYPGLPTPALFLGACAQGDLPLVMNVMKAIAPTLRVAPLSPEAAERWQASDCPVAHETFPFSAEKNVIIGREVNLVMIDAGTTEHPKRHFILHDRNGTILDWRIDDPFERGATECSINRVEPTRNAFEVETKCTMKRNNAAPMLEHQISEWSINVASIRVNTQREKINAQSGRSSNRTYLERRR